MAKEKFIDILDYTADDKKHEDDENLDLVLKDEDIENIDNVEQIGEKKVLESDDFIINIYQKEDYIDKIEVECKCGKITSFKMDYHDADPSIANSISDKAKDETEHRGDTIIKNKDVQFKKDGGNSIETNLNDDSEDEEAVFEEGLPAPEINDIPKHDTEELNNPDNKSQD